MDKTTTDIRNMYEQYPYPSGTPAIRLGSDVRRLLSYIERTGVRSGKIQALDAGCGRGLGTLACATLQPDIQFTGIDINRIAIKEAEAQAKDRGLSNVIFDECDLMTLEGLKVPENGFDVIYSSGVLHHLSNPLEGLARLRKVLSPHGVILLMVYGTHGRAPLYRMIKGIDLLMGDSIPITEKLSPARMLVDFATDQVLLNTPWEDTAKVNDVEFVDRCLNVNETSYTVTSLVEMINSAGLSFIQWVTPSDWAVAELLPEGELRKRALELNEMDQYRLIEQLFYRPQLELLLSISGNKPRASLREKKIPKAIFAIGHHVSFILETRNPHGSVRIEGLSYKIDNDDSVKLPVTGPLATAILILKDQNLPFSGESLLKALNDNGVSPKEGRSVIVELLARGIIYRPNPGDV
ncbi:MAG: class I SAM-dependent methyltransferase [Desulfobulbaceae bacterium]|nr:class I SAM-dependent methyltransferase [Desulfobulbaceae bacterium]